MLGAMDKRVSEEVTIPRVVPWQLLFSPVGLTAEHQGLLLHALGGDEALGVTHQLRVTAVT